jgi:hypothetical protein
VARSRGGIFGRIEIGPPLISVSIAIVAAGVGIAALSGAEFAGRIAIIVVAVLLVATVWVFGVRNNGVEREARRRLQAEHPGSLVERVRVWSLPHRRLEAGTPMHFLIADTRENVIETIDQTVLVRFPVAEVGFVDLVTAQGDRARDKALTIIYGDEQLTVQLFTVTYSGTE